MVSTAAWACIEFLQGVYHDKRKNHQPCLNSRLGLHWVFTRPMENRASAGLRSVSTAAWACIEFFPGQWKTELLLDWEASQQPLGLALSFYSASPGKNTGNTWRSLNSRLGLHWVFTIIKESKKWNSGQVSTAAWACIEFLPNYISEKTIVIK